MRPRLVLLVSAAVFGTAGGFALAFGLDAFALADRTVDDNPVWDFVGDNGGWLWPVAAAVVALLALLVLLSLLRGLRSDAVKETVFEPSGQRGRTVLSSGALVDAVVAEVEAGRGVLRARGRLVGDPELPRLLLRVTIGPRADVQEVLDRVQDEAVVHARAALDDPELPVVLTVAVAEEDPAAFS